MRVARRTSNVTLATPKTAFEIGFNYQVSIYYSFYVNVRETDLGEDSAIFNRPVHGFL